MRLALEEDAGKLGDVTTLATYAAAMRAGACCHAILQQWQLFLPSWNSVVYSHASASACCCRVAPGTQATAAFVAKAAGVLAGLAVVDEVRPPGAAQPSPRCCTDNPVWRPGAPWKGLHKLRLPHAHLLMQSNNETDSSWRGPQVFAVVDPAVRVAWSAADGQRVAKGTTFGTLRGSALSILTAERVALNFMQRMSGVATATAAMVAAVQVPSRQLYLL